jgi:L-histidine N-alpha-methyltransferase
MEDHNRSRLRATRVLPVRPIPGIAEDAATGLLGEPRSIPPKYFYDERGSRLFDAICETREYYPTRTEEKLLVEYSNDIMSVVRPDHIVEFGSGAARKTRHLLSACDQHKETVAYWPFDVCEAMLLESGRRLVEEYDWLRVNALVGDYLGGLADLPRPAGNSLFLFLGGTIGNFTEPQAQQFLDEVRAVMVDGDYLLLGADRVKDADVLHAAYNDADGLTAEFNLNVLQVLNRELDADFEETCFEHAAVFNNEASQIEMYLVSRQRQSVHVGVLDETLQFAEGDKILTEISRKFTPVHLESMLEAAGFRIERHLQPNNGYFSLLLARPVGQGFPGGL